MNLWAERFELGIRSVSSLPRGRDDLSLPQRGRGTAAAVDEEVTYQQIPLVAKGFLEDLNSVLIYLLIHRKRSPFPAGEG